MEVKLPANKQTDRPTNRRDGRTDRVVVKTSNNRSKCGRKEIGRRGNETGSGKHRQCRCKKTRHETIKTIKSGDVIL